MLRLALVLIFPFCLLASAVAAGRMAWAIVANPARAWPAPPWKTCPGTPA